MSDKGSNIMTALPQFGTRARLEAEIDRVERAIKAKQIDLGYLRVEIGDLELERTELREEIQKLGD